MHHFYLLLQREIQRKILRLELCRQIGPNTLCAWYRHDDLQEQQATLIHQDCTILIRQLLLFRT